MRRWKKADSNRTGKVRAGGILYRFETLEEIYEQGCWVDCSDCTMSYHYGCLPFDIKKDIARQHKQERDALLAKVESQKAEGDDDAAEVIDIPPVKKERQPDLRLSVKCPICVKLHGGKCTVCGEGLKTLEQTKSEKDRLLRQGARESLKTV